MKHIFSKTFPALILAMGLVSGQLSADEVTLKTTQVRGNVYLIEGVGGFAGGNVAVSIGDDGIMAIDSLVKGRAAQLTASLKKLDAKGKLRYLLNTHWHGDHTGGNADFSNDTPIIAHDNVRTRLMQDQKNYFGEAPASPEAAWPVLTFSNAMTLYFNGDSVQIKHYPHGHTDGDSMVYFAKANVLHMGDHYFRDIFPFVDLTTGGSVLGLAKNVAEVIKQLPEDVLIIPGHGALANLADLKRYYIMLQTSIEIVGKAMKAGLSLDKIQQQGLGQSVASFGNGFIPEKDWIKFVYQSIEQAEKLNK